MLRNQIYTQHRYIRIHFPSLSPLPFLSIQCCTI
uniref:Uncharacterized protein n=1 Tax=Lepeophtheirus salmonis TaxID=72036 RepID=A0A0K2VFH4_LEPSM